MNAKLELKHLAPYLPYELKVILKRDWHSNNWNDFDILIMDQLCDSEREWFYIGGHPEGNFGSHSNYEHDQWRPILRPLSDLTKEIEHNGEMFIPVCQLSKKLYDKEPESFDDVSGCQYWLRNHLESIQEHKEYDNILHWIFQDLIKWHFDVFGLIDQCLAVDKNTIEK